MGEVITDESKYDYDGAESKWLKFEEGTTAIRILSHSYHFRQHYIREEGRSYKCPGKDKCEWCQQGEKPSNRWAYLVLNRENEKVKIMEIGWSIMGTILELAKDDDYGNPRSYDIKVTRKGQGLETEYTVIPGKDKKFKENEQAEIMENNALNPNDATKELLSYYEDADVETMIKDFEESQND